LLVWVLLGVAPGCAPPLREVMLIVTTDLDCESMSRVEVRLSRGASEATVYQGTFQRTECLNAGVTVASGISLGRGQEFRLGIVDGRRTDERLRIELVGQGNNGVATTARAETRFVDGKVYGLRMNLSQFCRTGAAGTVCPGGQVCHAETTSLAPSCVNIFREPGVGPTASLGEPVTVTITAGGTP
jgi:hypothetical protein